MKNKFVFLKIVNIEADELGTSIKCLCSGVKKENISVPEFINKKLTIFFI